MGAAPIWWMCPNERKARAASWDFDLRVSNYSGVEHDVVRTGRTRPNASNLRGPRTLDVVVEFRCKTCGHQGWTKHVDIERYPEEAS
jgi:hypothetical protein